MKLIKTNLVRDELSITRVVFTAQGLTMMMIVQFRPYCQVWRLGPLDLTHKAQRSLQPRHS